VAALSTAHIQRIVVNLREEGKSPSTIRNILMPLRVLVRREQLNQHLDRDPFVKGLLPTGSGRRMRFATRHEVDRLLGVLDYPERAFFAIAFYAGLRSGEISALRWRNIDTAAHRVCVRRAYDLHSRKVTEPKSEKGRREIPLAPLLEVILDEYRAIVAVEKGAESIAPDALVFQAPRAGGPLGGDVVTSWARKQWAAHDLTPVGLHDCRHTFASLQIAMGTEQKRLQSYMGHASLSITMDRYGHLYPVDMSTEADRWGDFLTAHRDN
jgi:integrase